MTVESSFFAVTLSSGSVSDPEWGNSIRTLLLDKRRTAAETAAGITPSNYSYFPGDIRRYGALADGTTNCSSAIQAAIDQAQYPYSNASSAPVYIPPASQGWKIVTGLAANGAGFRMYGGGNAYFSALYTTADIAALTITDQVQYQGVDIQNVCFIKTSGTPTKAGIHYKNSSYCRLAGSIVQGFKYNVRYEPTATSPASCFSNSIEDSTLVGATGTAPWNIYAEAATNHLTLRNVTAGGTTGGALYMIDSIGLTWHGGDAESLSGAVGIDIDATSDIRIAAKITGVDFEACSCASGIIRLGNTAIVRNISIETNGFVNAGASEYIVNPVRADHLSVKNNAVNTGTNSGYHVKPTSTTRTNFDIDGNTWQTAIGATTYSASITPDAGLSDVTLITITNGSALTINLPVGLATGPREYQIWISNTSGGAHGTITMGSGFKAAGAMPAIATGNRRVFKYRFDGTNLYETGRSAADIAN